LAEATAPFEWQNFLLDVILLNVRWDGRYSLIKIKKKAIAQNILETTRYNYQKFDDGYY
jgi:hypothetical protein